MDNYDEGYLRIAEEKLEGIYNLALERARKTVPEAEYVIDTRTMDDYITKVWDYPVSLPTFKMCKKAAFLLIFFRRWNIIKKVREV